MKLKLVSVEQIENPIENSLSPPQKAVMNMARTLMASDFAVSIRISFELACARVRNKLQNLFRQHELQPIDWCELVAQMY